jgi:signal peptidase I
MFGRRSQDEDDEPRKRGSPPDRSLSTRIAWLVLFGGGSLIALRATIATVVQVHGDGMAPTIVDGDTVVLVRGRWSVGNGDIVIYDPTPNTLEDPAGTLPRPTPGAEDEQPDYPDARKRPVKAMRNTAVVDEDEFEGNWERVQQKSGVDADKARTLRVGRVIASPGDTVTFNVQDAAMGLSVNGVPVRQKAGDTMRIVLRGEPVLGEDPAEVGRPRIRATAYEWLGDVRYSVLTNTADTAWTQLALPEERGPVQVHAPGYLILADNRNEGACCDSRAIGWVIPENVRGEVVARIAGNTNATPDMDPRARGPALLP